MKSHDKIELKDSNYVIYITLILLQFCFLYQCFQSINIIFVLPRSICALGPKPNEKLEGKISENHLFQKKGKEN